MLARVTQVFHIQVILNYFNYLLIQDLVFVLSLYYKYLSAHQCLLLISCQ